MVLRGALPWLMIVQPTESLAKLANVVRAETKKPETRSLVEARIREFQAMQGEGDERWFEELVFCLLTANYSARGALTCISALNEKNAIGEGSLEQIRNCLEHRHRFPSKRAEFIHKAREHKGELKKTITSLPNSSDARDWLVENITGLGMKEASHFLRNVGYLNLAIIDKHILTHMLEQGIINERPKTLTRKKYLEYEAILMQVAARLDMPLGMMDLYLWAKKSGEVIK
jgi:N-glycosylase/DNA lyase